MVNPFKLLWRIEVMRITWLCGNERYPHDAWEGQALLALCDFGRRQHGLE